MLRPLPTFLRLSERCHWFTSIGTPKSTGTKVFALGGKINNTGLVEVPMGTKLRDIIYNIGGGIPNGKAFKAVQTGDPSGGCIPRLQLDIPIDYDTLTAIGSMMGVRRYDRHGRGQLHGGYRAFLPDFTVDEKLRQVHSCRIGTKRMLEILERIVEGKGEEGDIEKLEALGKTSRRPRCAALVRRLPTPSCPPSSTSVMSMRRTFMKNAARPITAQKLLNYDHRQVPWMYCLHQGLPRGCHHRYRQGNA